MDEETLVERVRGGDDEAFEKLVALYADRVHRLVASVLGPFSDLEAEDVTQEVFLKVHRKVRQFRGASSFGTWLYQVAYRTALEERRPARTRLPHVSVEEADRAVEGRPGEALAVARALESLPHLYRAVLTLHYWMGSSVEEIAAMLSIPSGTVKSHLSRARDRMRVELER
jgi:RNA polymerase sigma-70 factor (ECF subfamily)